jgi:hypothetical protein
MQGIPVCDSNWKGKKKEIFEWIPDPNNDVTFTQAVGYDWPFTLAPGFTVHAGQKLQCGLVDKAGTHHYNANPCKILGNPKTVIIS